MNVMYYLSAAMKTVGLFSFLIAAPICWIISFVLLHLQKNNKICRIGSWLLIAIIPYFVFVILLSMILENYMNSLVVFCLDGLLWSIPPLAHLIIIKAGRKEHSKILVWAGWLAGIGFCRLHGGRSIFGNQRTVHFKLLI